MKSFSEYTTGMLKSDLLSRSIAQMSFSSEGTTSKEADALEIKIGLILRLIQNIRLQSPANHTGLVIAFTSITKVPFPTDVGVKFSWFRVKGEERTLISDSSKAFYLPSIDDVGFKICVQCDDDFDQGLSRHLEVHEYIIVFIIFMETFCRFMNTEDIGYQLLIKDCLHILYIDLDA